jgi:hypothetical protein
MKKLLFIGLLLLEIGAVLAQQNDKVLYFNIGGGSHNLKYDIANGKQENDIGLTYNVGCDFFFSENWGLGTGLGLESFHAKSTLNYQTSKASVDTDGDSFEFRTQYANWKEKQNVLLLDIPLSFIHQKQINDNLKIQISVGPKVSFYVLSKYKSDGGTIETTGYYKKYNVTLYDLPQHNFTTITDVPEGNNSLNPILSTFINLGGLYKFNEKMDIYLGAYFEYGLNNAIDSQDKSLYQEDGVYNGVFSSDQTSKVKPQTFGFKVGLNLNLHTKNEILMKDIH